MSNKTTTTTTAVPTGKIWINLPDTFQDHYEIEAINGDNRRPNMDAGHRWLVRYGTLPSPLAGWACCRTFASKLEAYHFIGDLARGELA